MPKHKTRKNRKCEKKKVGGEYEFMDTIIIPENTYVFFCSTGHRPIKEGQLPIQPTLWAQIYASDYEPSPKDSWFCDNSPNGLRNNTFYVYKLKKPVKMFVDYEMEEKITRNITNVNKNLKHKFMHQSQASNYVEMGFMHKIFNIDGVFRGYGRSEVILFGPFEDKLEFVKMYGGEDAKTTWNDDNRYYTPSNETTIQIKKALTHLPYYSKLRNYVKNRESNFMNENYGLL